MLCCSCKCCKAMWFSGFFALACLVHVVRLALQVPLRLGDWPVPMGLSVGVVVVAGALSFILCRMGCSACSCSTAPKTK